METTQTKRKKFGGRKKGTPNKTTAAVKEAIQFVYEELGGNDAFVKWALTDDKTLSIFYERIYTKLIPLDVNADVKGGLSIQVVTGVPRAGEGTNDS